MYGAEWNGVRAGDDAAAPGESTNAPTLLAKVATQGVAPIGRVKASKCS